MQKRFACLSNFSGVPMTLELWEVLDFNLNRMILLGKDRIPIKTASCEGEIRTKFEIYCVGSFAGIKVDGFLESERGRGSISFLIQPAVELEEYMLDIRFGEPPLKFVPVSTMN